MIFNESKAPRELSIDEALRQLTAGRFLVRKSPRSAFYYFWDVRPHDYVKRSTYIELRTEGYITESRDITINKMKVWRATVKAQIVVREMGS